MGICTRDFVQCFSVDIDVMTNFIRDWLESTGMLPNSLSFRGILQATISFIRA